MSHRTRLPILLSILGLAALGALAPRGVAVSRGTASPDASIPEADNDPYVRIRGMTISCHGSGQAWGSDAMVESMRELRDLGVNWVTIHPYGGISNDGEVGGRMMRMYGDPTWLTRPIEEAHKLGLKIMIKPHIAYWGTRFSWRGDITFQDDESWARFFDSYEKWILHVAELSKDADAFVVGTELAATAHREKEWRRIISKVRERFDGPLSFAANWDRFEVVPFWDAVDVIGIQGYFPLVGHDRLPEQTELDAAWTTLVTRLDAFGAKHRRPVMLAELGYTRSSVAAARPWEYKEGGDGADEVQRRCMRAALAALEKSDGVRGAFLWKWFPGQRTRRGNFLMDTDSMREEIGSAWREHAIPDSAADAE